MDASNNLAQLNAIRWTPERYAHFIARIQRGEALGSAVSSHKQRAFVARVQHRFSVTGDDELLFDGEPIVRQDCVQQVLRQYYDDVSKSRNGRDSFYARISAEVFGISRRAVQRFLATQESYQTHLPLVAKHRVVQPIVARRPFARWQVDLIDVSEHAYWNVGYAYALTCIDCFSKRVHVRPLKDKSGGVAAAMRMIFLASVSWPSVVSSDRGTEFTSGEFQAVLSEHGVEHVLSSAYYPQSHGQIERFNRTFKCLLYAYMDRNDTRFWTRALPALVRNYNSSVHSVTKCRPEQIHRDDLDEHTRRAVYERLQRAAQRYVQQSAKKGRRMSTTIELEVGDTVRVSLLTKASVRRDTMLASSYKGYAQQWSTGLYRVASKSANTPEWYTLRDEDGELVRKRYYRYQLQKIDADTLVRSTRQQLARVPVTPVVVGSPQSPRSPPLPPYDREAHVASLSEKRRNKQPYELPASSALEERRHGSVAREIRARKRLVEEGEEKEEEEEEEGS